MVSDCIAYPILLGTYPPMVSQCVLLPSPRRLSAQPNIMSFYFPHLHHYDRNASVPSRCRLTITTFMPEIIGPQSHKLVEEIYVRRLRRVMCTNLP